MGPSMGLSTDADRVMNGTWIGVRGLPGEHPPQDAEELRKLRVWINGQRILWFFFYCLTPEVRCQWRRILGWHGIDEALWQKTLQVPVGGSLIDLVLSVYLHITPRLLELLYKESTLDDAQVVVAAHLDPHRDHCNKLAINRDENQYNAV